MLKRKIVILVALIIICQIPIMLNAAVTSSRGENLVSLIERTRCEKSAVEVNALQYNIYEHNIASLENEIAGYNEQIADVQNQGLLGELSVKYELAVALDEYKIDNLKMQKDLLNDDTNQKILSARYRVQQEYYNACMYKYQEKLSSDNLTYFNKQLLVERQKLELGESTELSVQFIENQIAVEEAAISGYREKISAYKKSICVLMENFSLSDLDLDMDLYECFPAEYKKDLDRLEENFFNNNISVRQLSGTISYQQIYLDKIRNVVSEYSLEYLLAEDELKQYELNLTIMKAQYSAEIQKAYAEYLLYYGSFNALQKQTALISSEEKILEETYDVGEISELDYLKQKSLIEEKKSKIISAYIQADNAAALLNLIENGVLE